MVTPEQRATARKIATQTAVLLRDENNLLPLNPTYKTIALIGPLADSKPDIMGSWCLAGHPSDTVTVLEGMRNHYGASHILYTRGVEIERDPALHLRRRNSPAPSPP